MRHVALQGAAVIVVLSLAWPYFGMRGEALPWLGTSLAIGGVACILATLTRLATGGKIAQTAFMPTLWLLQELAVDPGWLLLLAIALLLAYRHLLAGQIPLALADPGSLKALHSVLAAQAPSRIIQLGAGVGSTLIPMADALPEHQFTACENTFPRWLIGRLLGIGRSNLSWRWEDMWQLSLADYDIVYASLAPAPMHRLWEKLQAELPPGSLFISRAFPVPGATPIRMVDIEGKPELALYCYRTPAC